jgi:hypothetical protein
MPSTVRDGICLASVIRPDGPAPNGQEGLAQGSPGVRRKIRFALKGLEMRTRVRFEGSEPILVLPGNPFTATAGGWRFPRVNPGLPGLGYAFLATSGRKTLNRYPGRGLSASLPRHFVPGYYRAVPPGQNQSPIEAPRIKSTTARIGPRPDRTWSDIPSGKSPCSCRVVVRKGIPPGTGRFTDGDPKIHPSGLDGLTASQDLCRSGPGINPAPREPR